MQEKHWEDFEVGQVLVSSAVTVTEAHIVNFANLTGDWFPLHMDEEYAKQSQFGGRIAHGPLTFSLAAGLVVMSGLLGDAPQGLLGVDGMRFLGPVRIGDTIHVEVEVASKRPTSRPERGVSELDYRALNQRGETVLSMRFTLLMKRRTPWLG